MPIFLYFCFAHNFLNIDPVLLTKPVRIESPERELSIGAGFVKIGSILRKLWAKHCRDQNYEIRLGHSGDFMLRIARKRFFLDRFFYPRKRFFFDEKANYFFTRKRIFFSSKLVEKKKSPGC